MPDGIQQVSINTLFFSDFVPSLSREYGNCYTFNSNQLANKTKSFRSIKSGYNLGIPQFCCLFQVVQSLFYFFFHVSFVSINIQTCSMIGPNIKFYLMKFIEFYWIEQEIQQPSVPSVSLPNVIHHRIYHCCTWGRRNYQFFFVFFFQHPLNNRPYFNIPLSNFAMYIGKGARRRKCCCWLILS